MYLHAQWIYCLVCLLSTVHVSLVQGKVGREHHFTLSLVIHLIRLHSHSLLLSSSKAELAFAVVLLPLSPALGDGESVLLNCSTTHSLWPMTGMCACNMGCMVQFGARFPRLFVPVLAVCRHGVPVTCYIH